MSAAQGVSTPHPGAEAAWGPNLWLIRAPGTLHLSGDGRFDALELGPADVEALLEYSRTGKAPPDLRPELCSALELRGWEPLHEDRSALGAGAVRTDGRMDRWSSVTTSQLVRVVSGAATGWDHFAGRGLFEITPAQLRDLCGDPGCAPHPVTHDGHDRGEAGPEAPGEDVGARPSRVVGLPPEVTADGRTPVWFATCARGPDGSPLALGMIQSSLRSFDDGALNELYDFRPIMVTAHDVLTDVAMLGRPGLLLLSNFHWTVEANLELAAEVKRLQPKTLTVFGGPSAPKYEGDATEFFRTHPQVDVIVRGEGEITAAEMFAELGGDVDRIGRVASVPGLTVRLGDQLVRTAERDRMPNPNIVPSPYLTGLFDHLADMDGIWAVETNRGCPYGCTFCDWGSATMSRVRSFELDRVMGELAWLAEHGIDAVFVSDANFGMFRRDIEIAQRVADLREQHQAPNSFIACFAKNTTKHTLPIVEILQRAGLHAEATLSFQTVDEQTLLNVRRQNVKQSVYDELTLDARHRGLPVLSDLMLGLPGMTMETMKTDFEHCMDGEVTARIFGTLVLPNSPMNDPEYRAEHGIVVDSEMQLVGSTSFSPADREEMVRFRDLWRVAEHFGVLRELLRFVRDETGRRAIDVLWELYRCALAEPDRFPLTSWFAISARRHLTVPMAWEPFFEEVRSLLTERLGVIDDSALSAAITVQQALLPAPERRFPELLVLPHDYVAYRRQRGDTNRRLVDFGPGELTIEDPDDKCSTAMCDLEVLRTQEGNRWLIEEIGFMDDHNWELTSPLSRDLRGVYLTRKADLAG